MCVYVCVKETGMDHDEMKAKNSSEVGEITEQIKAARSDMYSVRAWRSGRT